MLKDPDAVLDYAWDWSAWLDGDTITSADVTGDGVTIASVTHDDTRVTAWISGGDVNTAVAVTCRVTTAAGRTDDRAVRLDIKNR